MTYRQALLYLNSLINYEKQNSYDYNRSFSLDRMIRLCRKLGDPQDGIKSIHVAGSKGKGSTSVFIYSILKSAGYKVGLYTSPHLVSFRERIRINDILISEESFAGILGDVKKAIESIPEEEYSFFEAFTALCYLYFNKKRLDFAVYEVGLGGRLDATNLVMPLVSVITPISYEHTDKLGNTLGRIALEKSGIIKDNGICVSAPQQEEAYRAIEEICKKRRARLISIGTDITIGSDKATVKGGEFDLSGIFGTCLRLKTRLLGSHQIVNAATAAAAIGCLKYAGIGISGEAIRSGLLNASWPGRLEVISASPKIILDGAQNRASAKALADSIRNIFGLRKLILVLGVSRDKDISGILDELLPIAGKVILTKARVTERATEPAEIMARIGDHSMETVLTSGVEEAVLKARRNAGAKDAILITGSLFIVGEARKLLVDGYKDK